MNKYWGTGIKENRYYTEWVKIFETKDKNASTLYSILKDESCNSEDFSIGCQAIINFVVINSLWVSSELFFDLLVGVKENMKYIDEWFTCSENIDTVYKNEWANERKNALINYIEEFNAWPKVVSNKYDINNVLSNAIEEQIALGTDVKVVLNNMFTGLKNIARSKYEVFPNITVPTDFNDKLTDVVISLRELERKGVEVSDTISKVNSLLSVKKWLI
jgi:hypothetical protein